MKTENSKNTKKNQGRPNEIPEKRESEKERSGYPHVTEQEQQQQGSDASYSEQVDVTPPNQREFPSVGNPETDFRPSDHGRRTGRMVGHEPGTEGLPG